MPLAIAWISLGLRVLEWLAFNELLLPLNKSFWVQHRRDLARHSQYQCSQLSSTCRKHSVWCEHLSKIKDWSFLHFLLANKNAPGCYLQAGLEKL